MNTANKLTLLRVVLIPVYLTVLYIGFPYSTYVAMGIFILASLTDFADGYIARKRSQETDFGKFSDPLADKILVVSAMIWFVEIGIMPGWIALVVIVREFMVTGLRLVAVAEGRVIAAGILGKIKTVVTMISLISMHVITDGWIVYVFLGAITLTTVISGVEYYVKNYDVLKLVLHS